MNPLGPLEESLGQYMDNLDEEIEMESLQAAEPPSNVEVEESMIIRTGSMVFEIEKLAPAKSEIDGHLSDLDAYYENDHYSSYGNRNVCKLKIRVPNE